MRPPTPRKSRQTPPEIEPIDNAPETHRQSPRRRSPRPRSHSGQDSKGDQLDTTSNQTGLLVREPDTGSMNSNNPISASGGAHLLQRGLAPSSRAAPAPHPYAVDPHTFVRDQVIRLRGRYDQAAISVATRLRDEHAQFGIPTTYIDRLLKKLQQQQSFTMGLRLNAQHPPAESLIVKGKLSQKAIDEIFPEDYPDRLARQICKETGQEFGKIRTLVKDAYIRGLNEADWRTIQKPITIPGGNTLCTSTMTPVNQEFHETFAHYGRTGNSSMSPRLTDDPQKKNELRPTNLWLTQHRTGAPGDANGKVIFEAFRSGSLAYSLDDAPEDMRRTISRSKTRELINAMVVHHLNTHPELRDQILRGEIGDMDILSASLQTPTDIGVLGAEEKQVRDQIASLMEYHNTINEFDISWGGKPLKVKMRCHVIALDFGVNSASNVSVTPLGASGTQQKLNQDGFHALFGAYKSFKGQQETKIELFRKQLRQGMPDNERKRILATIAEMQSDVHKADGLWAQIDAAWSSGGKAYELPARVVNLGHIMKHKVHFNCKSGKDRTGLMDVEAKFLAQQLDARGAAPEYINELQGTELETYRKLLFESGNLEVQEYNTGVKGYKVVPLKLLELDLAERLGDILPLLQGMKQFTDVKQTYEESTVNQVKGKVKSIFEKISSAVQ